MSYFPFDQLYNLTSTATSMYGYKHTEDSIAKMKARFIDPKNHPMFVLKQRPIILIRVNLLVNQVH